MRRHKTRQAPRGESQLKEIVVKEVRRLMENRHRLLAPFPLDVDEVYRCIFTEEQFAAVQVLKDMKILGTMTWFNITHIPFDGRERMVTVTVPTYPMPDQNSIIYRNLPRSMREQIIEWLPRWVVLRIQTNELVRKVEQVANVCSTVGHAARIWPELVGFFSDSARYSIDNARVKSRYPERAMDMSWDRESHVRSYTLNEKFRPEVFGPYNELIAECLMLPYEDGVHKATVNE